MTHQDAATLLQSAQASIPLILDGHVRFPRNRIGDECVTDAGHPFVVYRETVLDVDDEGRGETEAREEPTQNGCVLVFGIELAEPSSDDALQAALFNPLANVATPFFAGLPGFRTKLWLYGEQPGEFLELYEWATVEDAERFEAMLRELLEPFAFAGSVWFETHDDTTTDEYVATHTGGWHDDTDGTPRGARRVGLVIGAIAALVAGAVVLRRRRRHRTPREERRQSVSREA